jgi:hypothetical protein
MKLTNMDLVKGVMEKLAEGKVGFYWETEDNCPVIEVFMYDTDGVVRAKMKEIKERMMEVNIPDAQYDMDSETLHFETNYRRIMIYFGRNIVDTDLINMIDILRNYGSPIWN